MGSLVLPAFLNGDSFNFTELESAARTAVRLLDDVIDVSQCRYPELTAGIRANRKIGIGFMGLADLFALLDMPYDSDEARVIAGRISECIYRSAKLESESLAVERGTYPNWPNGAGEGDPPRRNATLTSIAPTGHISLLANCSPSIEPYFRVAFKRQAAGVRIEICSPLVSRLKRIGYSLAQWIEDTLAQDSTFVFDGTLAGLVDHVANRKEVSNELERIKEVFSTSGEISPEAQLRMISCIQVFVDSSVSKTVNVSDTACVQIIEKTFKSAIEFKLRGVTVFRSTTSGPESLSCEIVHGAENNCLQKGSCG